MILKMEPGNSKYDIIIEHGAISKAAEYFNLDRKVLIVTDSGVPAEYAETVAKQCAEPFIMTVPCGEESKSLKTFELLQKAMLEHGFSRKDCAVAVGGGVVGDLTGFAASAYMRGIDFYNIPTTLLSQVDSSIGGKVGINFMHVKNIIGTFYQPKGVLIDSDTLKSLSPRQISNGLAEAIKVGVTSDKSLFEIFEKDDFMENLDEIILKALKVKKYVVEKDEKESGLRKILNFGHTVGHGIEVNTDLYHGECVALGMIAMSKGEALKRLVPVLKRAGLKTEYTADKEKVLAAMLHDKKLAGNKVTIVTADKIGEGKLQDIDAHALKDYLK